MYQDNAGGGAVASEVPSSVDAEQYLAAVVAAMPSAVLLRPDSDSAGWNMAVSTTSIYSLAGMSDVLVAFYADQEEPFLQRHGGNRYTDQILR